MSDRQIAHDVGVTHRKIRPQLTALKELGLILEGDFEGERALFLVDPTHALREYAKRPDLPADERAALVRVEEDIDMMGPGKTPTASEEASPPEPAEEPPPAGRPKVSPKPPAGFSRFKGKAKKTKPQQ